MLFIIIINVIMLLLLLGSALYSFYSFAYDIVYYYGMTRLVFDLGFFSMFALLIYCLGKMTFYLLI